MEQKRSIKIRLLTLILIIVILVLGTYTLINYIRKMVYETEYAELVESYQKDEKDYQSMIEKLNNARDKLEQYKANSKNMNDEEKIETLKELYNFIKELGYEDKDEIEASIEQQIENINNSEIPQNNIANQNENTNNNNTLKNDTNRTENSKKGNLDIDSQLVKDLHKKVLKSDYYSEGIDTSFYKNKKVTFENLSNDEMLRYVLLHLPQKERISFEDIDRNVAEEIGYIYGQEENFEQPVHDLIMYTKDELKQAEVKAFGKNVEIEYEDIGLSGYSYDFKDGNLYIYSYDGGGFVDIREAFTKIEYAIQNGDVIEIYDKFIYLRNYGAMLGFGGEYDCFTISPTADNAADAFGLNKIDFDYSLDKIIDDGGKTLIEDFYDKLYTYKHTFKKTAEGKDYIWVSSEIVEK